MISAAELDAADRLARVRQRFDLPDGLIYLDGNSLGPLPHGVADRVAEVVTGQWGDRLIRGWNDAGWIDLPRTVGNRIARLIGAPPGSVVAGDTTTLNVAKVVAAARRLRPDRPVVLSDSGNFPTDLYIARSVVAALGGRLVVVEPEQVGEHLDEQVGALLLTHVDYRTGRMHDMAGLTAAAHEHGALAVWDLCHSVGAVEVDLSRSDVDLAVGCTYKYLNGGPGSPAFAFAAPRLADDIDPLLAGWMGHAAPFDFDLDYAPAEGVDRLRVGTPPVIALAALDAALDVWDGVAMSDVRAKSVALAERFIHQVEATCPDLTLRSPRDPAQRGSQVSFAHRDGYAIVQALIADGVIGDFRAPDVLRFGFTPLYLSFADVDEAASRLATVLAERRYDDPKLRERSPVT